MSKHSRLPGTRNSPNTSIAEFQVAVVSRFSLSWKEAPLQFREPCLPFRVKMSHWCLQKVGNPRIVRLNCRQNFYLKFQQTLSSFPGYYWILPNGRQKVESVWQDSKCSLNPFGRIQIWKWHTLNNFTAFTLSILFRWRRPRLDQSRRSHYPWSTSDHLGSSWFSARRRHKGLLRAS